MSYLTARGNRSLGNLSSIDFRANPAAYGPHQLCTVNARDRSKTRKSRPLSKIKTPKLDEYDHRDIFSVEIKEKKARESPYLRHLKQQKREEMLMELGSIVNTIDDELSVEIQLRLKLEEIIHPETNSKSYALKKSNKAAKKNMMPKLEPIEKLDTNLIHYELDSLSNNDESALREIEKGWGFSDSSVNCSPRLNQYLSEFENDSSYDGEYINISPLSGGYVDEAFGPDIYISRQGSPDPDSGLRLEHFDRS
jgi:hypothetical protein